MFSVPVKQQISIPAVDLILSKSKSSITTTPDGQRVNCLNGFCEDHFALWQGYRTMAGVRICRLPGTSNPGWRQNSLFARDCAPWLELEFVLYQGRLTLAGVRIRRLPGTANPG